MKPCEELSMPTLVFDPTLEQPAFERQFFSCILGRNGDHIDALRRMVEIFATAGEHEKALPLDFRLVRLLPQNCIVRYNLSCSLAMTGQIEAALDELQTAIHCGYSDVVHLQTDPDLDPLREHPRYREMIRRFRGIR